MIYEYCNRSMDARHSFLGQLALHTWPLLHAKNRQIGLRPADVAKAPANQSKKYEAIEIDTPAQSRKQRRNHARRLPRESGSILHSEIVRKWTNDGMLLAVQWRGARYSEEDVLAKADVAHPKRYPNAKARPRRTNARQRARRANR